MVTCCVQGLVAPADPVAAAPVPASGLPPGGCPCGPRQSWTASFCSQFGAPGKGNSGLKERKSKYFDHTGARIENCGGPGLWGPLCTLSRTSFRLGNWPGIGSEVVSLLRVAGQRPLTQFFVLSLQSSKLFARSQIWQHKRSQCDQSVGKIIVPKSAQKHGPAIAETLSKVFV